MEKGFHVSLIGGSHKQNGKPVQDSSAAARGDGWNIAVVCDGHGADVHFRSHIGSRIAAETALAKLMEFAQAYPTYDDANQNFAKKAERLKLSIVTTWLKEIEKDYTTNSFTEDELKKGVPAGVSYLSRYTRLTPYGTTMLAVLLAKNYYVALMIGDGVIIKMTPDKAAEEEKFEGKRLWDKVESLCNPDAAFKIYVKCVELTAKEKDTAFVLCSDGFCESEAFVSRQSMLDWPKRYISYIAKRGMEEAMEGISAQLNEVSNRSSAMDDISIAIAVKDPTAYMIKSPQRDSKDEKQEAESASKESSAIEVAKTSATQTLDKESEHSAETEEVQNDTNGTADSSNKSEIVEAETSKDEAEHVQAQASERNDLKDEDGKENDEEGDV